MASPRVLAAASSANADLARQSPLYPVGHQADFRGDQTKGGVGSINMEELLRTFYADSPAGAAAGPTAEISPDPGPQTGGVEGGGGVADAGGGEMTVYRGDGQKMVEEVWTEISAGTRSVGGGGEPVYKETGLGGITLEAFLARAGTVTEEEVGAAPGPVQQQVDGPMLGFVIDPVLGDGFVQQQQQLLLVDGSHAKSADGVEGGRKRSVQDPLDKASQQKQRRMIKNRESAARSRERKQAYTADLEKLVTKLEEENARLVRQQEEQKKARLKQLMENLIPVEKMRRPPRRLRRTSSMQW